MLFKIILLQIILNYSWFSTLILYFKLFLGYFKLLYHMLFFVNIDFFTLNYFRLLYLR
jgi:hypothetical protein